MRHWFCPAVGIFLAFWLLLMVTGNSRLLRDPGTQWHTRVGDRLIEVGFFETDPYSFTYQGEAWIPHQWLGEVLMSLIHRIGGLDALLVSTATIIATIFTFLAVRLMRMGMHWSIATVIVVAALAASSSNFHARPLLATLIGMAVTFALILDIDADRRRLPIVWVLVPIFWLWANFHGGMLGALATLALASAGWLLAWLLGFDSPIRQRRDVLHLLGVGFLTLGLVIVNPYGPRLPQTWMTIMGTDALKNVIEEHRPLELSEAKTWPIVGFAILYITLLVTLKRRPRFVWLIPLVWFLLTIDRVRHAPLFAIVGVLAIAEFFPYTRLADRLLRKQSDWYQPEQGRVVSMMPVLITAMLTLGISFTVQATGAKVPIVGRGWARLDPHHWPVELIPLLRAHQHAEPDGTPIFNEFRQGGFLIYHAPGYRVFIDDRCELYHGDRIVEYVAADRTDTAGQMQRWEDEFGGWNFALTWIGSGFDDYFAASTEWERLGSSQTAALYRRKPSG